MDRLFARCAWYQQTTHTSIPPTALPPHRAVLNALHTPHHAPPPLLPHHAARGSTTFHGFAFPLPAFTYRHTPFPFPCARDTRHTTDRTGALHYYGSRFTHYLGVAFYTRCSPHSTHPTTAFPHGCHRYGHHYTLLTHHTHTHTMGAPHDTHVAISRTWMNGLRCACHTTHAVDRHALPRYLRTCRLHASRWTLPYTPRHHADVSRAVQDG